jgi:hypothetical protein
MSKAIVDVIMLTNNEVAIALCIFMCIALNKGGNAVPPLPPLKPISVFAKNAPKNKFVFVGFNEL